MSNIWFPKFIGPMLICGTALMMAPIYVGMAMGHTLYYFGYKLASLISSPCARKWHIVEQLVLPLSLLY